MALGSVLDSRCSGRFVHDFFSVVTVGNVVREGHRHLKYLAARRELCTERLKYVRSIYRTPPVHRAIAVHASPGRSSIATVECGHQFYDSPVWCR